jgi:hypothetical protein
VSSLAPPVSSAARPLEDQARSLIEFLANHGHQLAPADAARICSRLPDDHKPAAKALRAELAELNVDIKHTHALKALTVARGAAGYLGLASDVGYEVASYSLDAPSVSAERKTFTSFADAADEVCARIRSDFEDAPPFAKLATRPDHLLMTLSSEATGANWNFVLAARKSGSKGRFNDVAELQRFAERLRRLVEGELGGWLDGVYDVEQGHADDASDVLLMSRDESDLWRLCGISESTSATQMAAQPNPWPSTTIPLSAEQWAKFVKRSATFAERHEQAVPGWVRHVRAITSEARFEPVKLDVTAVDEARGGWAWQDIAMRLQHLGFSQALATEPAKGRADLRVVFALSRILEVADPNDLLPAAAVSPRIPLTVHADIASWLSGMAATTWVAKTASETQQALAKRLQAFCDVPLEERRQWQKQPPRHLEALNQEIRFLGLVVCAGMATRFVKDLPIDIYRPAAVSLLTFEKVGDVLTQDGKLKRGSRSFNMKREKDPVTPEWLKRFNRPRFTANDLVRYSDQVHDLMKDDQDERDRFTSKALAGVRLFKKDPEKAHAATVRMEALSLLTEGLPMEPWIRKSADPAEGTLMISEAAFEAAARCELVDISGTPGFDARDFYKLCAAHSHKYA